MLRINYTQIEIGMVLSRPVFEQKGSNLLASPGTVINDFILRRFQALRLPALYIKIPDYNKEEINKVAQEIPSINNLPDCSAKKAYCGAYLTYKKFSSSIQNGESLSLSMIEHVVTEIIECINEDKSITTQLTQIKSLENYTIVHSINVTIFSLILGKSLKLSFNNLLALGMGAFLHDIGRLYIPLEILNKPDKLTREEFEIVQGHTYYGYKEALKILGLRDVVSRIILEHHEKLDGSGYPNGKEAKDIHPFSQIVAVCDVYDALTSKNVYRSDFSPHEAVEYLYALCSEKKLDIDLIKDFLAHITIYPYGAVLLLSDGNLAKVIHVTEGMPLRPVVEIIGVECDIIDLVEKPAILISKIISSN